MNVTQIYVRKGNIFRHRGGLIRVNFPFYYSNALNSKKQLSATGILGNAHSDYGGISKLIIIQQIEFNQGGNVSTPSRRYKGNLLPANMDYRPSEIAALNSTSSDFVTYYRVPFLQMEVFEIPVSDHVYIGEPKTYGCGSAALVVSAQDSHSDYSKGLFASAVPFVLC
jgi:hypothetical protein